MFKYTVYDLIEEISDNDSGNTENFIYCYRNKEKIKEILDKIIYPIEIEFGIKNVIQKFTLPKFMKERFINNNSVFSAITSFNGCVLELDSSYTNNKLINNNGITVETIDNDNKIYLFKI